MERVAAAPRREPASIFGLVGALSIASGITLLFVTGLCCIFQLWLSGLRGSLTPSDVTLDEAMLAARPVLLLFFVMSALLVPIGVGQLNRCRWAWRLTIIWAVLALAQLTWMVWFADAVFGPALQQLSASYTDITGRPAPAISWDLYEATLVKTPALMAAVYALYPTGLLVLFTRQRAEMWPDRP